ncbi:MAG: VanW family protein [Candidatus Shapirobacteria bacterium]|jgi:vancomycin resistance protein YoaR
MKKLIKPKSPFLVPFLLLSLLLLVFLPFFLAFNKTGDHTTLLGHDYSLISKDEITGKIEKDFPETGKLTLIDPSGRSHSLDLSTIGFSVNASKTASDMLFRRLHRGPLRYITDFFTPKDFILEIDFDPEKYQQSVEVIISEINRPFVPAEIILVKSDPQVKAGELGLEVNRDQLHQDILLALSHYQLNSPITISVSNIGSLPSSASETTALAQAKNLINKKLVLTSSEPPFEVDSNTLVSWVGFESTCHQSQVEEFITNFSSTFKKDPIDAVFQFDAGKVTDFQSAKNGFSVDTAKFTPLLCSQLQNLIVSTSPSISVDIPLNFVEPKIKTSDVNQLGIKELLGRGSSTFSHSTAIRNFNVEKGASIVNRILVAPNETFSFIKNLGEVTLDNGYKKAYIIRQGKTELDVGGGICQVSTTLFRAMLNAGLDITQRQNHAYRVRYYEEDMPPGYDATVFIPNPDLKFVNDTGNHVLIQSFYDGKLKKLTYEIYGTSDGRKVDITNYRQWGAAPPPPAVYIDDPTLAPGKTIQDEQAIPGLKTAFDWKVTRGGEVIHQKTFQSIFVPWAAVYRRGPSP